jgi:hypothetical protein
LIRSARFPNRRRGSARVLLALALFLIAFFALRSTSLDRSLGSDEPEWIAISILHWNQLTRSTPADPIPQPIQHPIQHTDEPDASDNPWKSGFQIVDFGWKNPCLPKLILGATLAALGHRQASPLVFERFHTDNPQQGLAARAELLPAKPAASRVVLGFSALCAVCLFFISAQVGGLTAGALAFSAWIFTPLVRTWANYVRTDLFMIAFSLMALATALCLRKALSGRAGAGRQALAAAALGLLAGAVVSSKFNGGPVCLAVALWTAGLWWSARAEHGLSFARGVLPAWLCAGLAAALVFFATNPVLWRDPLGEFSSLVRFWGPHMVWQQDRAESYGVLVSRTLPDKIDLALLRALGRDEPLRALLHLRGGALVLVAGLGWLVARCLRRGDASAVEDSERAFVLLAFVLVFAAGTTVWLPMDWDRYFFPYVVCMIALEAVALAALFHAGLSFARRRLKPRPAPS